MKRLPPASVVQRESNVVTGVCPQEVGYHLISDPSSLVPGAFPGTPPVRPVAGGGDTPRQHRGTPNRIGVTPPPGQDRSNPLRARLRHGRYASRSFTQEHFLVLTVYSFFIISAKLIIRLHHHHINSGSSQQNEDGRLRVSEA